MENRLEQQYDKLDNEYNMLMSSLKVSVSKHLLDEHFTVIWANDYYYELIGYPKEEYEAIFHNQCDRFFVNNREDWDYIVRNVTEALEAKASGYSGTARMQNKDGTMMWVRIMGTFTKEMRNGYPIVYTIMTNVSDLVNIQMEQTVTYDNIPGFIAKIRVRDEGYEFVEANEKFKDFFGIEDIKGHRLSQWEQERNAETFQKYHAIMRLGEQVHFVIYTRDKEGRDAWLQLNGDCIDHIDGDPIYLVVYIDITDITEQKKLQKQLEERSDQLKDALESAERANRAKSDFLARMSHDIRTPMNAIIGMTAIAGAHVDDRERVLDCLKKITGSSRLLLSLINEVLDMSRIESGRLDLSDEEFDLGELCQDLIVMMQPDVKSKDHQLDVRVRGIEHEKVIGDSQRVKQVLMNIFSNAVKYTPDHGHILVEITEKPAKTNGVGWYEFVVEDNGRGMKKEFLEKIFTPFERAEDQEIRNIQGTGLGMAISNNIVQMMGGSIRVESRYGEGSRFTVELPLRLQNLDQTLEGILANLPVLVTDDDQVVCENTCHCLKELGMEPEWVTSGREAVENVTRRHEAGRGYFAAIVDLKMPGMDGVETTRQIRRAVGPSVPIIIISAYDMEEYETEARKAGANGFISKPLFKSKLAYILKRFALKENEPVREWKMNVKNADYSGKRILVVEDNELNREIARELIGSTGATVEEAENGLDAVNMVASSAERHYDMIFMDVQMPVMNGYDAARSIRGLKRQDVRRMPIVAMTANAFLEDVKHALEAGMDYHLSKPIEIAQLMDVLERYLGGAGDSGTNQAKSR